MNQIGRINFDFTMHNEEFARSLYSRWDGFFARCFESVADKILMKYDVANEHIEIMALELDLGIMNENDFDTQFPLRLRDKLDEAIRKCIAKSPSEGGVIRSVNTYDSFELICQFLLHGTMPWSARSQFGDISKLLLTVFATRSGELKRFLRTYGHYTTLQQRLVYQLDDLLLERGVHLISPAESTFIISYVRLLVSKYKAVKRPAVTRISHRHLAWKVVYAYLLTNRSSYFNKKSFVGHTIAHLGAEYNIGYETLLEMLGRDMEQLPMESSLEPELFRLIGDLKRDMDERQFESSARSAAVLYKSLAQYFAEELTAGLNENSIEAIKIILSRVDTCREFLRLLSEQEIIRLVPIIIPQDSEFVIDYVRSLDGQRDKGGLEGRAGGEFTKLKWEIIFAIMFENRGTTFNRKSFVRAVLREIAAHYNLIVTDILEYLLPEIGRMDSDKELYTILNEYYLELQPADSGDMVQIGEPINIHKLIRENKTLSSTIRAGLLKKLSDVVSCRELLANMSEDEHRRFARIIAVEDAEYVISYAAGLDRQKERGALEGKTGSEFGLLKWIFIWTLIADSSHKSYNRKYFTAVVIRRIAAHYNLAYIELLGYFNSDKGRLFLNVRVMKTLDELYRDERDGVADIVIKNGRTEAMDSYVATFFSSEQGFIRGYVRWLTGSLRVLLPSVSESELHTYLWRTVLIVLRRYRRVGESERRNYAPDILIAVTNHFGVDVSQILGVTVSLLLDSGPNKAVAEIVDFLRVNIPTDSYSTKSDTPHLVSTNKSVPVNNADGEASSLSENNPDANYVHISGQNDMNPENIQTEFPEKRANRPQDKQLGSNEDPMYVNNAGIVLVAPYLPRLFDILGFMYEGVFRDDEARIRAMFVIQYLVFENTVAPEYEMVLNKLLVRLESEIPIPYELELSEHEKQQADGMLRGAINNWPKLSKSSLAALREGFLQREGKIVTTDRGLLLTVESKSYDMLLDSLPWSISAIKFSWMDELIEVKWR